MRDRRAREHDTAGEDWPERSAGRAAGPGEPPHAERHECCRRAGGEPQVDVLDRARDVREGMDEKDVVRAVVPARRVEEGIAEQRAAERGERGLKVDGDDERAGALRAQHTARESDDEVKEDGEREDGGEGPEASKERWPTVPAGPDRSEPEKPSKQCEVADPPALARERRDDTGRHERQTGQDRKGGGELGLARVRRVLARPARNGERAETVNARDCAGCEPNEVRRRDGDPRHLAIVSRLCAATFVLATTPALGAATMCAALVDRTVASTLAKRSETMAKVTTRLAAITLAAIAAVAANGLQRRRRRQGRRRRPAGRASTGQHGRRHRPDTRGEVLRRARR